MIGTIGHMGRVHVYTDNQRGWAVASITGAIRDHGLEELRVRDYWAIKRKTIDQPKLDEIQNTIQQNISMRDAGNLFFVFSQKFYYFLTLNLFW